MAFYNHVQYVFDRENLSPDEDVAVMTMHIREVVAGAPDILPVTDQGRSNFITRTQDWWGLQRSMISDNLFFREIRFYDVPDTPGANMGDPVLVHPMGEAGGSTTQTLPPQVSLSVTFKTAKRLTWGRFYIPGMTTSFLEATGRLDPSIGEQICTWTHHLTSRSGTGAALVVFSRKEWTHHDPQTIQVDDIFDVIRRRRFSRPNVRATLSAG